MQVTKKISLTTYCNNIEQKISFFHPTNISFAESLWEGNDYTSKKLMLVLVTSSNGQQETNRDKTTFFKLIN